ncbi:response regulator [Bradyrhizobium sp. CCBAU 53351]|uniref:response regulator n=1 Tax=Bradyrhizobium sp. CCBAU 53351 TaxID=1325114 RepID=UPI0018883229|nr:response regulator [Bradyrhizobium sp. CCBAU 53351]QOZ78557.1 response regulator [Bradyrhizobium sp. CCBAU 53351]
MASVLLIEDETLIRMMIADMLAELGHSLVGEAGDLAGGLQLAGAPDIHAAILDVQLGADSSGPIAEALQSRGVPFAFATGYGSKGLPENFKNSLVLRKPFPLEELERCLKLLLG